MICFRCGSNDVIRRGIHNNKQTYQCSKCNRYFKGEIEPKQENDDFLAVLVFDIETLPIIAYAWGGYDQTILPHQIIKDWCILSWSAKWLDDEKIISDILTSSEAMERNDKRLVNGFWSMLDNADVVIAHNGNKFDVKKLNTRFMFNKMTPPSSYKVVDTLTAARSVFGMTFNSLDYLAEYLGIQRKLHTEFELWRKCDVGDRDALIEMRGYNERDVDVLEEVYMKIRPWIPNHPKLTSYNKVIDKCPICFGNYENIGFYQAPKKQFKEFRCTQCGAVFHSSKPEK